jgi:hypothetical protein
MMFDIDVTVELEKFGFTHGLTGYFSSRCGINSLHQGLFRSYGFEL